ncbi:MobF family relaxase [Bosea beijingensis]|uniref:MobF family relaxase n=1 Tax=Bosea beijingensis TaxID=3068632 RepID=UPI002741A882|nr:MobF family relaxase [Bosea sp. REN20]
MVISITRVASVEYYEKQSEIAGQERDQVAYYQENETCGVWWRAGGPADDYPLPTLSPFRFCKNGEAVDGRLLRDLCAGRDPETGAALVRQSANGKRSAGFDIQIGPPKPVSVLAAFADDETRRKIEQAHDKSIRRALRFVHEAGLIDARRGEGGRGKDGIGDNAPPAEIAAAVYRHFTSRANDPQLHSHCVLINLAVREDGTTGSIDNATVMSFRGAIAALYRAELASELRRQLGIETERDGRNFKVSGVPETLVTQFSKRRKEIERIASERGFSTAQNRDSAQHAAYQSRDDKDRETPLSELQKQWLGELGAAGWNPEALFRSVEVQSAQACAERLVDGDRSERLTRLALEAIDSLSETESVFTRADVLREVFEAVQCEVDADEAQELVEQVIAGGQIIEIGRHDKSRIPVFTTQAIIDAEREMLAAATAGKGARDYVTAESLEQVLADKMDPAQTKRMSAEQAVAVRHALNNDIVSIVEGSAGAGKSFSMGAVREIAEARANGKRVWGIAPSWKAVDSLRNEIGLAENLSYSAQGMLVKMLKTGEVKIDENTVIIADEAGMMSTKDLSALVVACVKAKAKLILTGDTKQLQSVEAGSPMALLIEAIGSVRISKIQRQRGRDDHEGKWMRAASMDFAAGHTDRALEAYDRAGAIDWMDDRNAAIAKLVSDYLASLGAVAADGRPKTRAILTGWNSDARFINGLIREKLFRRGALSGGVVVRTIPRGLEKAEEIEFAAGDDIIFGESVELESVTIRNADLAKIESISNEPDPLLTFRLNKNASELVTARLSDLVGKRFGNEPVAPKIQHSYAMTVHASQGITVDNVFVANLRGMGRSASYVAMTRHRETVQLYFDTSRIRDRLEAAVPGIVRTGKRIARTFDADDLPPAEVTDAAIKKAAIAESMKSDRKSNAADYWRSVSDFVEGKPNRAQSEAGEQAPPVSPTEQLKQRMNSRLHSESKYPLPPVDLATVLRGRDHKHGPIPARDNINGERNDHNRNNERIQLGPYQRPEQRDVGLRKYLRESYDLSFGGGPQAKSLLSLRNLSSSRLARSSRRIASLLQGDARSSLHHGGAERADRLRWSGNGNRADVSEGGRVAGTARTGSPFSRVEAARVSPVDMLLIERQSMIQVATEHLGGRILRSWNSNRNHRVQFADHPEPVQIAKSERTGRWTWSTISDATRRGVADLVAKVRDLAPEKAVAWLRERTRHAVANPIAKALQSSPAEIEERRLQFITARTRIAETEQTKARDPDRSRESRREAEFSM